MTLQHLYEQLSLCRAFCPVPGPRTAIDSVLGELGSFIVTEKLYSNCALILFVCTTFLTLYLQSAYNSPSESIETMSFQ